MFKETDNRFHSHRHRHKCVRTPVCVCAVCVPQADCIGAEIRE